MPSAPFRRVLVCCKLVNGAHRGAGHRGQGGLLPAEQKFTGLGTCQGGHLSTPTCPSACLPTPTLEESPSPQVCPVRIYFWEGQAVTDCGHRGTRLESLLGTPTAADWHPAFEKQPTVSNRMRAGSTLTQLFCSISGFKGPPSDLGDPGLRTCWQNWALPWVFCRKLL